MDYTIYADLSLNHGGVIVMSSTNEKVYLYTFASGESFYFKVNSLVEAFAVTNAAHVTLVYEATVFGRMGRGFSQYNMMLGALLYKLTTVCKKLTVLSCGPTTVKKIVAGKGSADKLEILSKVHQYVPKSATRVGKPSKVTTWTTQDDYKKFDKEYDLSDAYSVKLAHELSKDSFKEEFVIVCT
jgi:hypothetical protein